MLDIFVQVSKYLLIILMALYTINAVLLLMVSEPEKRKSYVDRETFLMVLFNVLAFAVLYLASRDQRMLYIAGGVLGYSLVIQYLYRIIYKKASIALVNTMCMLLSTGFVIQSRLGTTTALKQLIIVIIASILCLAIPVFVRRVKVMRNIPVVYAVLGILLLAGVFALGRVSGGANLSLTIGGISFQFSEFVKITFVFFIAGMLQKDTGFRQVCIVTVLAAIHVLILVMSKDLGAALIYFVAYIVMVCVASRQPGYAAIGIGGMAAASVLAYRLFAHVRVRVQVWRDPFADYEGTGYQVVQALFGVCAGGWFGTGLFAGNPDMIPVAIEDFTFAAICEEMGVIFGILLIFVCMSMYLQIVTISTKLSNPFYRLVAIGLGTEYAFQVFLTVGGNTKFIPMTGITLPLVSYGGSSIMCTLIMLSIIQGLYMIREDEDKDRALLEEIIRRQNMKERQINSRRRSARAQKSSSGASGQGKTMFFRRSEASGIGATKVSAAPSGKAGKRSNTGKKVIRKASPEINADIQEHREAYEELMRKIPSAEKENIDIDELTKRIQDETEKSLNY
ncbi:MAG TPA: FtsW/RodA/SpoVE family cell cycle protein [Lachnospiraceae bacterium]|nr:FtsW/RodA/SpoVE family cell cycle protein [Lachnospiraceae bacterium]